mmetsp:Transcript_1711/g.2881  ORF Transcript_1711/g.2881 Transcript_1711/m.2881 type:complete len:274 (-) Transcript_1711:75-896(-)|eukprot:CAMPEP_0168581966 /NCGR_PEP_ID=MMETSP0420-20121227/1714_1 /TAXON_ID=498008 /ORGANISM="Pessonella sp." /LENGTH=273 /DNA_ID=CAMNT_0008616389 /DNA_START=28 /DNA_END=849 /DNA_ORIENTATION=+
MATDQELVQICTSFMLTAPPGEFMEVVTDIRGLLSNEALLNSSAPATFRQYNQEQMLEVQSPAGHKFLITEFGEVGDGQYVDPRGKIVVKFDHIKQQVLGQAGPAQVDAGIEATRAAFDAAAQKYQANHYPEGTVTVYAKGKNIIICIQSSKYNPNNFWNGRWRSVYTCTVGGDVQVKGNIKIQVHYYEDGNVQLNTNTNKAFKVPGGDAASAAKHTIEAIKKAEQAFHQSLEVSYNTMGDTTFKALRRALPLTRTKIDWNKIRNYRINVTGK